MALPVVLTKFNRLFAVNTDKSQFPYLLTWKEEAAGAPGSPTRQTRLPPAPVAWAADSASDSLPLCIRLLQAIGSGQGIELRQIPMSAKGFQLLAFT